MTAVIWGNRYECWDPNEATSLEALRIEGRWAPSDEALQASDEWTMEYDGAPAWNAAHCSGGFTEGGQAILEELMGRFSGISKIEGYSCRPNTGNTSRMSVHGTGRALDIFIPTIGGDADNTVGDEVAHWLMRNSRRIGIQYIIWDRAQWNGSRSPGNRVRGYTGPNAHVDHLHVEITLAASKGQTDFFGAGGLDNEAPRYVNHPAPQGPCGTLQSGEALDQNEALTSCGGGVVLYHQRDGNLVLYRRGDASVVIPKPRPKPRTWLSKTQET